MEQSANAHRVLVLTPVGRDSALTADLLQRAGLTSHVCDSIEALCDAMSEGAGAAIIGEEALAPAAFEPLQGVLEAQPAWSDLPCIVFARTAPLARSRAIELIQAIANVTLLDRPVRGKILLSAVHAALRARRRQYEAKNAIIQRDNFLAMLGHELRNPLGAIALASDVLAETQSIVPTQKRFFEIIERQTKNLNRLVDDLLDVARVTSGKVALRKEPIDLARSLERAIETTRAPERILALVQESLFVIGDAVRLEQVFVNLLGNAIKYTPGQQPVEVTLERDGRSAVVRVADHGIGIAPGVLPHVFELFTQDTAALDRSKGGLGIGLTVVKGLVELHGGRVEAHSEGPNKGSVFTVRLPLMADATVPAPGALTALPNVQRRVLIIEDSDDLRDSLRDCLEHRGHQVSAAEDGLSGLKTMLASKPDVALVDIGLPGLDGYEVSRATRRDLGDSVRLIALSGYGQPADKARAREAGFDAHMTKPIDLPKLLELIAQ